MKSRWCEAVCARRYLLASARTLVYPNTPHGGSAGFGGRRPNSRAFTLFGWQCGQYSTAPGDFLSGVAGMAPLTAQEWVRTLGGGKDSSKPIEHPFMQLQNYLGGSGVTGTVGPGGFLSVGPGMAPPAAQAWVRALGRDSSKRE